VYSEFGGRHGLYELNYAGNHEQKYLDPLQWAERRGFMQQWKELVDECLSQYDLDGWRDATWVWEPNGRER
jgi:4-hydroxyphenylacetate 3-monooxygenase